MQSKKKKKKRLPNWYRKDSQCLSGTMIPYISLTIPFHLLWAKQSAYVCISPGTSFFLPFTQQQSIANVLKFRSPKLLQNGIGKQCRPRSDCSLRSSLIWVCTVWHSTYYFKKQLHKNVSDNMAYVNSANPDQNAPEGAVLSGSILFIIPLSNLRSHCIKNNLG